MIKLDPGDVSHMVIFEEMVVLHTWELDLVPFMPASVLDVGGHIGL